MTSHQIDAVPDTLWEPDMLGPSYQQRVLPLGDDPDGEGDISATLIRRKFNADRPRAVILHVHGLSDYFFHTHLADFLAEKDIATYGIDLRKCGRSRRDGHTPHFVSDLQMYDAELNIALSVIARAHPGVPVVMSAHSTGGLIVPLWLARRRDGDGVEPVAAMVLDSPWFDLDMPPAVRPIADLTIDSLGRRAPRYRLPLPSSDLYGRSTHAAYDGDFDYDLRLKPFGGVGVRAGWLRTIRHAHRQLHAGLDLALPVLLLRSSASSTRSVKPDPDTDLILDVTSMIRHADKIGPKVTDCPIPHARHDVFISRPDVLVTVFDQLGQWLDHTVLHSQPANQESSE